MGSCLAFTSPAPLPLALRGAGLLPVPSTGHIPPATGSLHKVFTLTEFSCQHPLAQPPPPNILCLSLSLTHTHTYHQVILYLAFRWRKAITDLEWRSDSLHTFLEQRCFSLLTLTSAYSYMQYTFKFNVNFSTLPPNYAIKRGICFLF